MSKEMNQENFITYEQALALKKLGFKEKVNHYYNDKNELIESLADFNNEDSYNSPDTAYDDFNHGYCDEVFCSAPTLAQASKWLRDEKDLFIEINYDYEKATWDFDVFNLNYTIYEYVTLDEEYSSYEDALRDGINKCIIVLENNEITETSKENPNS